MTRRNTVGVVVLYSLPLTVGAGSISAAAAETNIACLLELELPAFAVASRVPEGGEATAIVQIGKDGLPGKMDIRASHPSLATEIEYHLRKRASYDANCAGKSVTLEFAFRVSGEPRPNPFTKVRFLPPNKFVLTTQPSAPIVDYLPAPPSKE